MQNLKLDKLTEIVISADVHSFIYELRTYELMNSTPF